MNSSVKTILAAIVGVTIGTGIGLTLMHYFVDPYIASKTKPAVQSLTSQEISDNFRRDLLVVEEMKKLDDHSRKLACEGYIDGLQDQNLPISSVIAEACKL